MDQRKSQKIRLYLLGGLGFLIFTYGLVQMRQINLAREKLLNDSITRVKIEAVEAFPHLQFDQPVDLQHSPDGSDRIFVVEQRGIIRVFPNLLQVDKAKTFLDIRSLVFCGHSEEGMLGLAFHPQFKQNGTFYVYHTANHPRRSMVARYQVSATDPDQADPSSRQEILTVRQPFGNHKGGQLRFGPDGYLYIALGDGGSAGDPQGNGQNRTTLLGKILRIDVNKRSAESEYAIPFDNPFAGNAHGWREEIFAYGLRNPWRFSFDPITGWLWAGDVGQDRPIEEVNIIEKGKNYGWNIMEGSLCYKPLIGCNPRGLEKPVWEYSHHQGRSITGGVVYRGRANPALYGRYIYADFVSGRVWALSYDGKHSPHNGLLIHNPDAYISSFGIDQNQELYFCSFNGKIYKFVSRSNINNEKKIHPATVEKNKKT